MDYPRSLFCFIRPEGERLKKRGGVTQRTHFSRSLSFVLSLSLSLPSSPTRLWRASAPEKERVKFKIVKCYGPDSDRTSSLRHCGMICLARMCPRARALSLSLASSLSHSLSLSLLPSLARSFSLSLANLTWSLSLSLSSFLSLCATPTRIPFPRQVSKQILMYQSSISLTFSCYPKWEEITRELLPAQTVTDRPDLVCVITIPFFLIIVFGG